MKQYLNATAFRMALEEQLKNISKKEEMDVQRLRKEVAFDRFLARLFSKSELISWVLKGGYAMELWIKEARVSKDIDLVVHESLSTQKNLSQQSILTILREQASKDLKDFFLFRIDQSMQNLEGPPYGGARYPVHAVMDGRIFAKFHVDIALGDIVIEPLDRIKGKNWLKFAGFPDTEIISVSKEQQFAEKLHAYTRPREKTNSRVRDLVDLVLLIQHGLQSESNKVKKCILATFERYKTHPVSNKLEVPPKTWEKSYQQMAKEIGLAQNTIQAAFLVISQYLEKLFP